MQLIVFLFGTCFLFITKGNTMPVLLDQNTLALVFQADPSANCPSGYTQPANSNLTSCYKIYTYFTTSKNASNQCKKDNGTLASIPNEFVNTYLYYLATRADATSLWLGIECFNGDTSTCQNDDETQFGYSNFKSDSRQANPLESCVSMSTIGRDSQEWSTLDCRQRLNFVCKVAVSGSVIPEVRTTSTARSQTSPTPKIPLECPSNYTDFQGTCYKFVNLETLISANNASAECRKIPGGNLAVSPNPKINNFLKITERNEIPEGQGPVVAFGLRCPNVTYDGDTSSCKWDHGTDFLYDIFGRSGSVYPRDNNEHSGCCNFRFGYWYVCFDCDGVTVFTAYLCQAPKQP